MDLELKGRRALVCASSKGLGLAVARSLAAEGAHLCLCARDEATLTAAAKPLAETYRVPVHAVVMDLAVPGAPERLAREAQSRLGGVDLLINNVGGTAAVRGRRYPPAEAWQQGFQQIFLSATLLTTALLPAMRERRFGRIVTITSISVLEPIDHLVVSTAMRLAVTGFAKTLAAEVAADGVTVNTVLPGVIRTGRIEELRQAKAVRDGTTLESELAKTAKQIPAGRLGRPEELGDLVAFLCSGKASFLTGVNIPVDGGMRKGW